MTENFKHLCQRYWLVGYIMLYCFQEKQSQQTQDQDGGSLLANLQERLVETDQGTVVLSSTNLPLNSSNNAGMMSQSFKKSS